jgi:hypothetical protein
MIAPVYISLRRRYAPDTNVDRSGRYISRAAKRRRWHNPKHCQRLYERYYRGHGNLPCGIGHLRVYHHFYADGIPTNNDAVSDLVRWLPLSLLERLKKVLCKLTAIPGVGCAKNMEFLSLEWRKSFNEFGRLIASKTARDILRLKRPYFLVGFRQLPLQSFNLRPAAILCCILIALTLCFGVSRGDASQTVISEVIISAMPSAMNKIPNTTTAAI